MYCQISVNFQMGESSSIMEAITQENVSIIPTDSTRSKILSNIIQDILNVESAYYNESQVIFTQITSLKQTQDQLVRKIKKLKAFYPSMTQVAEFKEVSSQLYSSSMYESLVEEIKICENLLKEPESQLSLLKIELESVTKEAEKSRVKIFDIDSKRERLEELKLIEDQGKLTSSNLIEINDLISSLSVFGLELAEPLVV